MAILTISDGVMRVRHGNATVDLIASDFSIAEQNAITEARLEAAGTSLLGRQVFLHIFTRSPLAYVVSTGDLGSVRLPNWWDWNPRT